MTEDEVIKTIAEIDSFKDYFVRAIFGSKVCIYTGSSHDFYERHLRSLTYFVIYDGQDNINDPKYNITLSYTPVEKRFKLKFYSCVYYPMNSPILIFKNGQADRLEKTLRDMIDKLKEEY